MSRPANASSQAVRQALMLMQPISFIRLNLRVSCKTIGNQVTALGLQRVYLTRKERLLIGGRRRMKRSQVP